MTTPCRATCFATAIRCGRCACSTPTRCCGLTERSTTRRHWWWLLNANLGVSLVIALLGLAQHFDVRVFDSIFWYLQPTGRVDITLGNSTYVGAYMLVNLFLALGFLARSYGPRPSEESTDHRFTREERRRRRLQERQRRTSLHAWRLFWGLTALLCLWVGVAQANEDGLVGFMIGVPLGAGTGGWLGVKTIGGPTGGLVGGTIGIFAGG